MMEESLEQLKRLERERLKYRSLVETTTDPDAAQRHARKLARLNNDFNHLRKSIQAARQATNEPVPAEEEDFDRDEYLDILDDNERPTEQFNANDVGPDGQKLGDMIAAAAAKRAAKLEADRETRVAADSQRAQRQASTSPQRQASGGRAGPTLGFDEDDLALNAGAAQGRMLMWGLVLALLVGGVLSYFLMG